MLKRLRRKKNQYLDWFITNKPHISKGRLYTQRRFVEAIFLVLFASIAGFFLQLFGLRDNFPIEFAILICIVVLIWYKKSGDNRVAGNIFIGFFFFALTYDLLTYQDEVTGYFRWYVVLPMFSLLFINRNSTLFWSGVILLGTIALYFFDFSPGSLLASTDFKNYFFSDTVMYYLMIMLLIFIYHIGREVINEQLVREQKVLQGNTNDLLEMQDLLMEKNKELQTYAHVVSHDLKTPLRGILSFSEILKEQMEKGKSIGVESGVHLKFIHENAVQMEELIDDILRYAEFGNDHSKDFKQCDLNELIIQAIGSFPNKKIRNHIMLEQKNLPSIPVLPSQIKQVFLNLISNSLKFADKDRTLKIKILQKEYDQYIQLTFRDNGIGVKKENLQYMFLPFRRLNSHSKYSGSGIGLANCERVINRHQGSIWAESEFGEHLTVHIKLPKFNQSFSDTLSYSSNKSDLPKTAS